MPRLQVEIKDPDKPILLIVGDKSPLIKSLVKEYGDTFKIAQVSSQKPIDENIYHIDPTNAHLILNLEEKIEYGIVFLEDRMRDFAQSVFAKLEADHAKTIIITSVRDAEQYLDLALTIKKVSSFYFFFLGDLYSEDIEFDRDSEVGRLVEEALFKRTITLTGNDLKPIFPIYEKDAIVGINQVLLGPKSQNKYYYLFYDHPQTYISAIHIIERAEPDLKIVYNDSGVATRFEDITSIESAIEDKIVTKPKYLSAYLEGFEKSIKHFHARGPIKESEKPKIIAVPQKIVAQQKPKINFFNRAFFIACFLFIFVNILAGVSSILLFKDSLTSLKNGQYTKAGQSIGSAKTFFDITSPVSEVAVYLAGVAGFHEITAAYKTLTTTVSLTSIASSDFQTIADLGRGITSDTLSQKIGDAFFLYFKATQLAIETNNQTIKSLITPDISTALNLSSVAPQVLGFDRTKHYLVLFQNNGELRPTGGFIGSVGEATVTSGKIDSFNLQDVYQYDGQLKAHVEPYFIVRRYLQPHLYLRDSNFNPDFQQSASTAALLYDLETNKKVDGVIAVNFDAVNQIINAIGPIKLETYNQTLDESNTFTFLEKTIDNNFFPGSTQKKDVLQALFNKIMLTLEDRNAQIKVARLIPELIKEKNILFAFNEKSVQSAFSSLGFGGEYADHRDTPDDQINDFLGINEANIGVNKANIGVTRETNYEVDFSANKILSKVNHVLDNQSELQYKSYIRFLVPTGSSLTAVKINGQKQNIVAAVTDYQTYEARGFKAPTGLEVDASTVDEHQEFGFIVEVAPHTKQEIEVDYNNGLSIPGGSTVSYSLLLIKQPGTSEFPFNLTLNYGAGFSPKEVENAKLVSGSVVISDKVNTDREFQAQLLKNQ